MDRKPDADYELVVAYVRRRSVDAFRKLYERYQQKVYSTAWQVTGSASEAMDVTQEVFLRVHRKLDRFRFEASFSSWLYRLTVNLATDFRRRRRARWTQALDAMAEEAGGGASLFESDNPGPVTEAVKREQADEVLLALDVLSPKLREVVVLRYMQGLSYDEVAAVSYTHLRAHET